jgi:hypothetical protein
MNCTFILISFFIIQTCGEEKKICFTSFEVKRLLCKKMATSEQKVETKGTSSQTKSKKWNSLEHHT